MDHCITSKSIKLDVGVHKLMPAVAATMLAKSLDQFTFTLFTIVLPKHKGLGQGHTSICYGHACPWAVRKPFQVRSTSSNWQPPQPPLYTTTAAAAIATATTNATATARWPGASNSSSSASLFLHAGYRVCRPVCDLVRLVAVPG